MRHHRAGKKLGRDSAHRKALYANLAGALFTHGRIQTTVTKAKAVKPIAEELMFRDVAGGQWSDRVVDATGRAAGPRGTGIR